MSLISIKFLHSNSWPFKYHEPITLETTLKKSGLFSFFSPKCPNCAGEVENASSKSHVVDYGMTRLSEDIAYDVCLLGERENKSMTISILGVDIGKNSCSIVGVDKRGTAVLRRTMRRQTLIEFVTKLPSCIVAMEACCGAHHLGRIFVGCGHKIRLMSPEYVRPYVKAQKNDDRDAEGIAEAASRPTMRFVELKSEEQLDVQTLHRVRSRLVWQRAWCESAP